VVSDRHAASGSRSLSTKTMAAIALPLATPRSDLYARMMLWIDAHDNNHWNYAEAEFGPDYAIRFGQQVSVGKYQMNNFYHQGGESDHSDHDPTAQLPLERWVCVEMYFSQDRTAKLWIDGKLNDAASVPFTDNPIPRGINDVVFGQESYDPGSPNDMHIDDVVVSAHRIGCPPAATGK
jgi:hypothetical protein